MEEVRSPVRVLPRRGVLIMVLLFLTSTIEPYSAQEDRGVLSSFPLEFVDPIREHFCQGCPSQTASPCETGMQPTTLCQRACQMEDCPIEQCVDRSEESYPSCAESQETFCGFEDAVICQNTDRRGFCVFEKSDESVPLCICENQTGSEDDYQLWTYSCNEEDRQPYGGGTRTNKPPGDGKPEATTSPGQREGANAGKVNIAVPLLSSVLFVVLVVLLVVAVLLCRRRTGDSPTVPNKTPNGTTGSTNMELETNVSKRVVSPLPLVPGEYPQADFHTYCSLDYNEEGEGSTRYVVHGQNSAPSGADNVPNTKDAYSHEYSEVEKTHSTENITMSRPDCTTSTADSLQEDPVETETICSPVLTTAESETPLDVCGYEVAVIAPPKENTRSPGLKTAESETAIDRSGYEVAVVATPPADANGPSLYDHFDRSMSPLSNVTALSDQENSDYQHLVKA